jgi:hypothetical protein
MFVVNHVSWQLLNQTIRLVAGLLQGHCIRLGLRLKTDSQVMAELAGCCWERCSLLDPL